MKTSSEKLKPLYMVIREDLLLHYANTKDRNIPSERELCEKYSVCRPTVSKALEYFVKNDLIVRRPGKGSYFREDAIQSASRVKEVWAVIRKDWESWTTDYYFCSVIQGIMSVLGSEFRLCLEQYSETLLRKLSADETVASIWISPETTEVEAMRQIAASDRTVVAVNRVVDVPGIRSVSIDHVGAGAVAAREWAAAGVDKVCAVHIASEKKLYDEMMDGFRRTLAGEALPLACREVMIPQDDWRRRAAEGFDRLVREGERAFFVGTTALVPIILTVLEDRRLALGRDVALLTYGDNFRYEQDGVAALRQPGMELGASAGRIIRGLEFGGRLRLSPMELVRRASLPVPVEAAGAR